MIGPVHFFRAACIQAVETLSFRRSTGKAAASNLVILRIAREAFLNASQGHPASFPSGVTIPMPVYGNTEFS